MALRAQTCKKLLTERPRRACVERKGWEGMVSMGDGLGRVETPYLSVGASTVGLGKHGLCLSEQQGLICRRGAPARKLAKSKHSISVR